MEESKVKSVEFMSIEDCERLFRSTNNLDQITNPCYIQIKALEMYNNQFKSRIAELESNNNLLNSQFDEIKDIASEQQKRISELEAENKKLIETLENAKVDDGECNFLNENDFIQNEYGQFIYSSGPHSVNLKIILEEYAGQAVKEALSEAKKEIRSTILMLSAHPHNEPDSEFADRINGLQEVLKLIEK